MPDTASKQPRLNNTRELTTAGIWTVWEDYTAGENVVPPWGSPGRTAKLREAWRAEPILAGAVSSLVQKATSLDWQITGGRNRVRRYRDMLAEAEDSAGWTFYIERNLQDYLTTDLGGFTELARQGAAGPVTGIYNVDAACVALTGSRTTPVRYFPSLATGQGSGKSIPWGPLDYSRIVDLPSPDEARFGLGFCAVSRALKAAKILLALYNYEDERLRDMPLPGIVSITGMTQEEVKAAFALYDAKRRAKEQTTFKGVLWLAAQSSPINPIQIGFTPFAGLPEGFDREQVITQYVYMLSLDFGVDVREFWPASQTGATKAEAEIQHQKAKGKGFGRMISAVERGINWDVLPHGLEFLFDQRDSEDDLLRETIRERAIGNVRKLWEPTMAGEGIINTEEARRWLVEMGAAPDWLAETDQTTMYGSANVDEVTDEVVTEKARRAGLEPGEDLVSINAAGEVVTVWSSRKSFYVADWPVGEAGEQGSPCGGAEESSFPFGALTTE